VNQTNSIVFLGTSDFAVPSLERLVKDGLPVSLVITRPDRPARRGKKLTPSPVKIAAHRLGIEVYQPEQLEDGLERLQSLNPDVLVLVAYGMKVPGAVLDIPRLGAVNLHPSLLPKYRGAAPMQWALIQREKVTGVTTMYMDEGLDTGDIIYQEQMDVRPDETYGELSERCSVQGAELLSRTVRDVLDGIAPRVEQDHDKATKARLLKREDEKLDWNQDADKVAGWILGLSPKPGAYTYHGERRLKLCKARPVKEVPELEDAYFEESRVPGEVLQVVKTIGIVVGTASGVLLLEEIQPESRPRMDAVSYANGYGVNEGDVFHSGD